VRQFLVEAAVRGVLGAFLGDLLEFIRELIVVILPIIRSLESTLVFLLRQLCLLLELGTNIIALISEFVAFSGEKVELFGQLLDLGGEFVFRSIQVGLQALAPELEAELLLHYLADFGLLELVEFGFEVGIILFLQCDFCS
jgi:hypothetical protein